MPKKLEEQLKRRATRLYKLGKLKVRKGESRAEAIDRYVFGTLRKTGWKPKR